MSRFRASTLALAALSASCARPSAPRPPSVPAATYTNPVLAGDYPDPSVIRFGREYWATATSSEWGPPFPLLRSDDLVNWRVAGTVLPRPPAWASANFWAPEIAEHGGRFFVYYTARRRNGPLCVAVATAERPGGPYEDHGPLVCQEAGSIDAVPVTDERGQRYLIWKEDGNSRKRPTPLWAQKLDAQGTKLVERPVEILRNDRPWEAQLVEGPFVVQRNQWFYLFYSGNACCGRACNYALGVARSRAVLGPWEKNPGNPILRGNETWKCPGHGSMVRDAAGRDFLMYHAYKADDSVYVGRQALLDEVTWGADGWPLINGGAGPSGRAPSPSGVPERNGEYAFSAQFDSPDLSGWQWPLAKEPVVRVDPAAGVLLLGPQPNWAPEMAGAVLARSSTLGAYVATAQIDLTMRKPGTWMGLAAFGDPANAFGLAVGDGRVVLWRREKGEQETLTSRTAPEAGAVQLRVACRNGHLFRFALSADGQQWNDVGAELDGAYLPPWDRGVRVALTAGGARGTTARFAWVRIEPVK